MKTLSDRALQIFAILKEQTTLAWQQPAPAFQNADAASMCCQQSLQTLKEAFERRPPRTAAEKISFFKNIKPLFIAEQLYYNKLYLLHARWPPGSEEKQKEYLRCCLHEVYIFFEAHKEFCSYYRTGRTDCDNFYFIPGPRPAWQMPPGVCFNTTDAFSSGYDMLAGSMLAHERLLEYLEDKLESTGNNTSSPVMQQHPHLPWDGSKAALTELIYALDSTGMLGKTSLKDTIAVFEDLFQVNLDKHADILADICKRKINVTRFLDQLKAAFLKRIGSEQRGAQEEG